MDQVENRYIPTRPPSQGLRALGKNMWIYSIACIIYDISARTAAVQNVNNYCKDYDDL